MNFIKDVVWRLSMPLVLVIVNSEPTGKLFDNWERVTYLLFPRFVLFLLLSSKAPGIKLYGKVALALLIEVLCLTFVSWMFGRSIM